MRRRILSPKLIAWGGFSRHGVMATARRIRRAPRPTRAVRIAWVVPSTALIGLGVGLMLRAELGVPPFDVLLSAVDAQTPLSHGQAGWAVSGALMLVAVALGVKPRVAGLAYMATAGLAVDLAHGIIVTPDALATRIAMAGAGLVLLVAGIGVIVHTSATGGAFEMLMEGLHRRGLPAARTRGALEVATLLLGILAGGDFGVMTVVVALSIGPMIAVTLQAFADHRAGRTARVAATV